MRAQLIDFQYQIKWPLKYFNAPTTFQNIIPQSLAKKYVLNDTNQKTYKVAFLGDFMGVGNHQLTIGEKLQSILSSVDSVVINLESVIINSNGFILAKQYTSVDSFRELKSQLPMKNVIFGVANNHIFDFKLKGVESTLNEITRSGARYVGTKDIPFISLRKKLTLGASTLWHTKEDDISNKFNVDEKYSIQFLHWGDEFMSRPNNSQLELANKISMNSLCLMGHHSHTPQSIALTGKMPTAYSLGNFCTSYPSAKINQGLISIVEFGKSDDWSVVGGQWDFISIDVNKNSVNVDIAIEGES